MPIHEFPCNLFSFNFRCWYLFLFFNKFRCSFVCCRSACVCAHRSCILSWGAVGSQGYCKHPWLEAGVRFWGFQSDVCSSQLLVPALHFTCCVSSRGILLWHVFASMVMMVTWKTVVDEKPVFPIGPCKYGKTVLKKVTVEIRKGHMATNPIRTVSFTYINKALFI